MPTSTKQEPGPDVCITLIVQDGAQESPFFHTASTSKVELQESTEKHHPETHELLKFKGRCKLQAMKNRKCCIQLSALEHHVVNSQPQQVQHIGLCFHERLAPAFCNSLN